MSKETTAKPSSTQTSGGTVKLRMHKQQLFTSKVELGDYTFEGDEVVEVPAKDAEALLERRDERGRKYVSEAD